MNEIVALIRSIENLTRRVLNVETREQILQAWQAPTLINSWANSGGAYQTAGYWKDPWGVVHLRGRVTGGAYPSNAFILPQEYLPEGIASFYTPTAGVVQVMLSGAVNAASGSSPLSLDGISFRAFNHAYAREVLADSPNAYWKLGEQIVAVAVDSSGNGNTGTYTGGVTLAQPGALSGDTDTAALFDGSTGYVSVPQAAFPTSQAAVTLEGWVYLTSWDGMVFGGNAQANYLYIGGTGRLVGSYYISGTTRSATGATVLSLNTWHHVASTYDGDKVRVYVNGVQDGISASFPGTVQENSGVHRIGAWGASFWLEGRIDEVAIYPTALSAARILAHYQAGV